MTWLLGCANLITGEGNVLKGYVIRYVSINSPTENAKTIFRDSCRRCHYYKDHVSLHIALTSNRKSIMLLPSILLFVSTFSTFASATALTYKLTPNEKACFFTQVNQQGAKIAYYFAVSVLHSQFYYLEIL